MRVAPALLVTLLVAFTNRSEATDPVPPSQDLGRVGPSWPIAEPDLLEQLVAKAREAQGGDRAAQLEDRLRERAAHYAAGPPSLGLPRVRAQRSWGFDPSIVVPYDLQDAQGRTLVTGGTRVNPLERWAFTGSLLFLDADDPQQVAWLRSRLSTGAMPQQKAILTGGSPQQLARTLGQAVYFDQGGLLTRRFGIGSVPAIVAADPAAPRERLRISEVDPRDGGAR